MATNADAVAQAMDSNERSVEGQQHQEDFQRFIERDEKENDEWKALDVAMENSGSRLFVKLDNVRNHNRELYETCIQKPTKLIPAFEKALNDLIKELDAQYTRTHGDMKIAFQGTMATAQTGPRELSSRLLGKLVRVDGILTKCGLVRPKLARSVHYAKETGDFTERSYRDVYTMGGMPTNSTMPAKDAENNVLSVEYGLCEFQDHQACTLQEMPELSPPGQLPRHVEIILSQDLVDVAKPGDRVRVCGVYKAVTGGASGVFRTVILCNNVQMIQKELHQPKCTESDFNSIRKLSRTKKVFEQLAASMAPSIYGHDYIKKALLLMLIGGTEKNLENGTHLRGDINILMVGDPSTAKSQLLRFVLNTAPLAINTTGRGSSGVGLTAAVTQDSETGDRTLQAGAMVLADRGVVCIDEFDKMSDVDRVAIHEVMEQQTVTIAKAGIHASLNARCSVVAAANPIYGQYDTSKPPEKNIALPDSLLSRFDLLFIVKDNVEPEIDRAIADHVLKMHQFRMSREDLEDEEERLEQMQAGSQMYERSGNGGYQGRRPFTIPFLKKYITRAKKERPKLLQEAVDKIAEEYKEIRLVGAQGRTLPVTVRTLETIIRLSTAHAKCRLSSTVNDSDVEVAVTLMKFALYSEKKEESDEEDEEEDDGAYPGDMGGAAAGRRGASDAAAPMGSSSAAADSGAAAAQGDDVGDDLDIARRGRRRPGTDGAAAAAEPTAKRPRPAPQQSEERYALFCATLAGVRDEDDMSIEKDKALRAVKAGSSENFKEAEMEAYLLRMQSENMIMIGGGKLFFV